MAEEGPPRDMMGGVEANLGPQLGTDQDLLSSGAMDVRRLGVLDRALIMPMLYAKIREARGSTTWGIVRDEVLNLNISVGGRGRRDILRMQVASRGSGNLNVEAEMPQDKPGWFTRNISDRSWAEKKLKAEGEIT